MTASYLDITDWVAAATFSINSVVRASTGSTSNYLPLGYGPSTRSLFTLKDVDAKPKSHLEKEQIRLQVFKMAVTKILHANENAKLYETKHEGLQTPPKQDDQILLRSLVVRNWVSGKVVPPFFPAENGMLFIVVYVNDNN